MPVWTGGGYENRLASHAFTFYLSDQLCVGRKCFMMSCLYGLQQAAESRQRHHIVAAEPTDLCPQGLEIYGAESKDCLPQVKEASWIIDFSSSISCFLVGMSV